MKTKVTSAKLAKLASKTLKGYMPTLDEIHSLAASVLAQREHELDKAAAAPAAPEPELILDTPVEAPEAPASAEGDLATPGFWSKLFKK